MKSLEYTAVLIAVAFAYILFNFGIRADRFNRAGSRNLFMATLFIALGLLSCGTASGAEKQAQAGGDSQLQSKEAAQRLLRELFTTEQWKQFRDFWKKLDALEPKNGKYEGSLSLKEPESYKAELAERIAGLNGLGEGLISPVEVGLFNRICCERIEAYSFDRMSISRMMPPPSYFAKKRFLADMENKIDVLIRLKNSGKVSEEELKKVLSNIQDDIEAVSALDIISSKYYWRIDRFKEPSLFDGDARRAIDESMKSLEEDHSVYIGKLKARSDMTQDERLSFENTEKQYFETKKAVNQLKAVMPRLDEMIADLENG